MSDEKQSEDMVYEHHADPDGYFERLAVRGFLPPLAPAIMERLRQGVGLGIELLYYQKTEEYHRRKNALSQTHSPYVVRRDAKGDIHSLKTISKLVNKHDLPF